MDTTSVCSLLQHRDAGHDASVISCPSCSLKVIIFYAALCICQQRLFQVFFDIYLYLPLKWIYTDFNHKTERCAPSTPAPTTAACTKPVIMSPLSERDLVLLFCICFNCLIKYVYTKKKKKVSIESQVAKRYYFC